MSEVEPLELAYRCYQTATERSKSSTGRRAQRRPSQRIPDVVLVFDTETTVDETQRLTFMSYRFLQRVPDTTRYQCAEEGFVYADDLPCRDPGGYLNLQDYIAHHEAAVTRRDVPTRLKLVSQTVFLTSVLYRAAVRAGAAVVGFNLPFDLSRIAVRPAAGRGEHRRAINLIFWENPRVESRRRASMFRPGMSIKTLDGKRALMSFTNPFKDEPHGRERRGSLIDLRTVVFALTGEGSSLERACQLFDCPVGKGKASHHGTINVAYIDYNRQDVAATVSLFEACVREFLRHPVDQEMRQLLSPATLGKAYLDRMGVRPLLERQPDFPAHIIGHGAAAYYGGRAECRIRRTPLPVVYVDFRSMYPTVASLMRLWEFFTCERVVCADVTEAIKLLALTFSAGEAYQPEFWRHLNALVRVKPNGLVLPARAHYARGDPWQVGVNHVHLQEARWYALADVAAGMLASKAQPEILEAVMLVPVGRGEGLHPVQLAGEITIDPAQGDFFRTLVQERAKLEGRTDLGILERDRLNSVLKTMANAVAYGIQAETLPRDLPLGEHVVREIWSLFESPTTIETAHPEALRHFGFMPLAACVTAGARLMLELLEHEVTAAGGSYVMTDTDSMAIVASRTGELMPAPGGPEVDGQGREAVTALSWNQVDEIVERFARLNPYLPEVISGSILKIEKDNYDQAGNRRELECYAISAKRYCLFVRDESRRPEVVKYSEHGLGHLLNPIDPDSDDRDWIRTIWQHIVSEALGFVSELPAWKGRPAVTRLTVSATDTFNLFRQHNAGKPYSEHIKPFNFLLAAHLAPFGEPDGVDPAHFQLVAPYEQDASRWLKMEWLDRCSGEQYRVTTRGHHGTAGVARITTIADVVAAYKVRAEYKSSGPDGRPCNRATVGLLNRRHITAASETLIGKEAQHLDDMESGVIHDEDDAVSSYVDARLDPWGNVVLPILWELSVPAVARDAQLSERQVRRLLRGECYPRGAHRDLLTRIAADRARENLIAAGSFAPRDNLACGAAWLAAKTARVHVSS